MKSVADTKAKASLKLLSEVDETELAVRLIEAHGSMKRPAGKTAPELLADMPEEFRQIAIRQARTAILYMAECFGKAVRPQ